MRIRFETLGLILSASLIALPVYAQDDDAETMTDSAETGDTPESVDENESLGAPAPAQQARAGVEGFEIRRGLFVRGDFGVYFAIGGDDVERETGAVSDNSVSSVQPMIGVTAGYDLISSSTFNLSAGARFSYFAVSGASQVDLDAVAAGQADVTSFPEDYEIAQAGLALDATFMLDERFGILVHGDGGLAIVSPDPSLSATTGPAQGNEDDIAFFTEGAGDPVLGGVFSFGAGVEYNTKLTGFAIGATAAFTGVVTSDAFIPGVAIYIPLKYNF